MKPVAKAWILRLAGTVGAPPRPQRFTSGTRIGGMRYAPGGGSTGLLPYCVSGGATVSLQAESARRPRSARQAFLVMLGFLRNEAAPRTGSSRAIRRRAEARRRLRKLRALAARRRCSRRGWGCRGGAGIEAPRG